MPDATLVVGKSKTRKIGDCHYPKVKSFDDLLQPFSLELLALPVCIDAVVVWRHTRCAEHSRENRTAHAAYENA